jgi:hypothetical protein
VAQEPFERKRLIKSYQNVLSFYYIVCPEEFSSKVGVGDLELLLEACQSS